MTRAAKTSHVAQLTAEIDALNAARRAKLAAIGWRARKIILPYFSLHQLTYVAGNGDWYVNEQGGVRVDNDDLPDGISKLLMIEVAHNDYLGYYVDEIKPEHWKARP